METTQWKENVILVDADYVDGVAFNLIVNFERMLNRRIPKADLAQWLVCVALDGGVFGRGNEIQVVMIHGKGRKSWENFNPPAFADIDGKAFKEDKLGEFIMSLLSDETLVPGDNLFLQSFETLADAREVKRLIVVPDLVRCGEALRSVLKKTSGKDVTLLTMEPQVGSGFKSEILGYSLMSAMGIRGDEIK